MTLPSMFGPDPPIENVAARHSAFSQQIREYQVRYLTFVMKQGCSREDAEEIVDDAFIATYPRWMAGTPPTEPELQPYMFTTLRHRVAEHRRDSLRHKRRANCLAEPLDAAIDPSSPAAIDVHTAREFRESQAAAAALTDLDEHVQQAIESIPFTAIERKVIAVMNSPECVEAACLQHKVGRDSFYRLRGSVIARIVNWLADHR